jgi:hypothetical protein
MEGFQARIEVQSWLSSGKPVPTQGLSEFLGEKAPFIDVENCWPLHGTAKTRSGRPRCTCPGGCCVVLGGGDAWTAALVVPKGRPVVVVHRAVA